MAIVPKRLAEIVIDTGLARHEDVVEAAAIAEKEKAPLIAALVRHKNVDELALVAAIKREVRVVILDPGQVEHDPDAIREMPRDVCWRLRVMPLSVSVYEAGANVLHLAMADPTDTVAVAEVEHITGCQVETSLLPLSSIEEMVDKAYRAFVTEVIPRRRKPFGKGVKVTTEPMAQVKSSSLSGAGAKELKKPSTVPFHRVADEASVELRHQALLALLLEKDIISEGEYREKVRELMKRRDG